jgi:acetolactate synthase-1/2/3 large subunit
VVLDAEPSRSSGPGTAGGSGDPGVDLLVGQTLTDPSDVTGTDEQSAGPEPPVSGGGDEAAEASTEPPAIEPDAPQDDAIDVVEMAGPVDGEAAEAVDVEVVERIDAPPAHPPRPIVRPTVSRAVADALAAAGARFAFTVPGESFLPLLDDLDAAGIRVIATRHEGGASFMAAAAAHLTGRPQVVMGTRTVGAANAAIGIHTARQDSAPLVALFGQVRTPFRGREAFQESDLATGIGSLAKWAAEPTSASAAHEVIGDAIRQLGHGRPGPILLALPEDLLSDELPEPVAGVAAAGQGPPADRAMVRTVLRWLAASQRGVIMAGAGVLRARATRRLVTLAEALAVPVVTSWRRPDAFPNDHPNYLGMAGLWSAPTVRDRLRQADVILALGTRMGEVTTYDYEIPRSDTRWAHVDLEPRTARAGMSAPTLPIAADVSRFLDTAWADLRGAVLDNETRSARVAALDTDRAAYLAATEVSAGEWTGPGVHPGTVMTELQAALPVNAILSTDAGNFAGWLVRGYQFRRPGTFLGPTSGAMGYGLPAAIAASLVHPERVSVAVCGDGGFAMTMAELETAVRAGARPIVLVFDNGRYGTIRMHQDREGRAPIATDLGAIDVAGIATALGALGLRVERDAEVRPALDEALSAERPVVIHLALDPSWVSVDEPAVSGPA